MSSNPVGQRANMNTDAIIDGILIPGIREAMIIFQGELTSSSNPTLSECPHRHLAQCMHDFVKSVTIHGEDVLNATNWEISERWMCDYSCVAFDRFGRSNLLTRDQCSCRPKRARHDESLAPRARGATSDAGRYWSRCSASGSGWVKQGLFMQRARSLFDSTCGSGGRIAAQAVGIMYTAHELP
jgi:hypothetical protein